MKNNSKKYKRVGLSLIILGLILNPRIVRLATYNHRINNLSEIFLILLFETSLIALGGYILKTKTLPSWQKIRFGYQYIGTILLTTIVLFLVTGIGTFASLKIINVFLERSNPVSVKYRVDLSTVYPGMTRTDIDELLNETWSRPVQFEPYTQFRERPYQGKFINISADGYRHVKNQGPWPPPKENINIFVFGGSTTFGYGLPDDQTIPSYLQEIVGGGNLSKKVYVYNFARGVYFSEQERVLFEKLLNQGIVPDVAIFVDGLNDFAKNGDPEFTEKIASLLSLEQKPFLSSTVQYFQERVLSAYQPLFSTAATLLSKNNQNDLNDSKYDDPNRTTGVITRYLTNKKMVEAISGSFSVTPIFVWQPSPLYRYDLSSHLFAQGSFENYTYTRTGYAEVEKKANSRDFGEDFLWLGGIQQNIRRPLYVDKYHYTAEMSKIIASDIYDFLKSHYNGLQ